MPFEQATKPCQALQTTEDVGPTQTGGGGKPSQVPVGLEHTELRQNGTLVPDSGGSLCTGDCDVAAEPSGPSAPSAAELVWAGLAVVPRAEHPA